MKELKKNKLFIAIIVFIVFYIAYNPGKEMVPVEKLDIPSGLGVDIEFSSDGKPIYSTPISIYTFMGEENVIRKVIVGKGATIGETRADRQMQASGKYILGLEKVLIFGEDLARHSIGESINRLFANPSINDTAVVGVYKGTAADLLSMNIEGYISSSDYLEGLIKNIVYFNFYGDNYKLIDAYVRLGSEGRHVKLPYIELKDKKPKVTGIAIFHDDKMIIKLNLNEAKIMNFMREKKAMGNFTLGDDYYENICIYGKTRRKASCKKEGDKYIFTIDIAYAGEITNNSLYKDLEKDPKVVKKFETDMEKEIETECYEFINKMQKEYKEDLLGLGQIAVAKYGRHTGTNWDEVVSNSRIHVNVKVEVQKMGRGRY